MITETLFASRSQPLTITSSHIRVFEMLYRYDRLDFPTLAHLLRDLPWKTSTLRDYLRKLEQNNYIHTFQGNRSGQPIFALLDRGLACYLADQGEPIRRTTHPAHHDAERIRVHEVGLSKYLVARQQWLQHQKDPVSVCHRDIFNQSLHERVKQGHRLPVSFHHAGRLHHCHVKPDYVATISHHGHAMRSPVTEFDASTETLCPSNFRTSPANIAGKLVSYAAMLEKDVFGQFLGLVNVEIEFVFLSQRRLDNAAALARTLIPQPELAKRFFFAVQPPCPIGHADAYEQMRWVNGLGEMVERL